MFPRFILRLAGKALCDCSDLNAKSDELTIAVLSSGELESSTQGEHEVGVHCVDLISVQFLL